MWVMDHWLEALPAACPQDWSWQRVSWGLSPRSPGNCVAGPFGLGVYEYWICTKDDRGFYTLSLSKGRGFCQRHRILRPCSSLGRINPFPSTRLNRNLSKRGARGGREELFVENLVYVRQLLDFSRFSGILSLCFLIVHTHFLEVEKAERKK